MNGTDPDGRIVQCTQVSAEFTAIVGGGGCVMYCSDNCGNWGIFGGLQVTAGVAGGAGLSQITLPGVEYAMDVDGWGWSVQGSVLIAGGTVQGNNQGVTGGGGGVAAGKAGLSAGYGTTFLIDDLKDFSKGKCNQVKRGSPAPPCCQATSYGVPTNCIQGDPPWYWKALNCPGGASQCEQTRGICNGTKCK